MSARSLKGWLRPDLAVIGLALAFGIGIRVRLWWTDRPFWRDEAALVQSLDAYGPGELLGPLADAQSAPPGWLLAERAVIAIVGDGERAYRLLPLLLGCATLVLLALLAARLVTRRWTVVVPLLLAATLSELVFYTTQAKQYTADTFCVTLGLLLAVQLLTDESENRRRELWWYVLLGVAPWFSHGFMLAAPLLAGWVAVVQLRRRRRGIAELAVRLAVPAVSVLLAALWARHLTSQVSDFVDYWAGFFAPTGEGASGWASWNAWVWRELAVRELGFRYWWVAALCVAGLGIAVWRCRTRAAALLLVLPVVAAYVAALAGVYPFGRRLILFCVPGLLALLAVLVDAAADAGVRLPRPRLASTVAGLLAGALVFAAAWTTPARLGHDLRYLYGVDDYRWAFEFMASKWDSEDILVVGNGDRAAARVYAPRYHIPTDRIVRAMPVVDTTKRVGCALPRELTDADQVWLMTGDNVEVYKGVTSRYAVAAPLVDRYRIAWYDDRGLVTLQSALPESDPSKLPPPPAARCLDYAPLGKAGAPKYPPALPK